MSKGFLGIAVVASGVIVVALNIRPSLDPVLLSLSRNHGVHLLDVVGAAIVAAGSALIWTRGRTAS